MTREGVYRAKIGPTSSWAFFATACLLYALFVATPANAQIPPVSSAHTAPSFIASTLRTPGNGSTAAVKLEGAAESHNTAGAERTPIYQVWYFYLALLFFGITLPAHLYRRRMTLMKGRMGIVLEERSRIARECHDTLMAGFAAISWQLEATAKLFHDSQLESTPAAQSCDLARSMVAHCQAEARRIIWDLRETDEITSVLSHALTRSLAANQSGRNIETTLEVEGEEVQLAPGCVHHLVCIGQEAVTNAVRHADPSHISVHLKYEQDALRLCVRDDGRGYQASKRTTARSGHFGIAVMKERSEKLGGNFRIQPLAGSGTEVTVQVSFNALRHPTSQGQHLVRWIGI
jgi:signal transduction histidine kinase